MKNYSKVLTHTILLSAIFFSCSKKNDPLPPKPVVTTSPVTGITFVAASAGGNVSSDGGFAVTERGVCWSTGTMPSISDSKTSNGTGTGSFASSITGLKDGTLYNVRAYATNSAGTAYGNVISFTTQAVTDIDGNAYHTVTIGTQVWMVENLKVTKYNDGTSIPFVIDFTEWSNLKTAGFCWYNNDPSTFKNPYGALYNWYAVNTGKLCPVGWHVPTDSEWTILTTYLGTSVASDKIKEVGNTHWTTPNAGATNESGFTALPGGNRNGDGYGGGFYNLGILAAWWCSDQFSSTHGYTRSLDPGNPGVVLRGGDGKGQGISVRCIKD